MTEAGYKKRLVDWLRTNNVGVTTRIEDRFIKGIPDIQVSLHRRSFWFEYKVYRGKDVPSLKWMDNAVQLATLCNLERHAHAYYLVFCTADSRLYVHRPCNVKSGFSLPWVIFDQKTQFVQLREFMEDLCRKA